MRHKRKLIVLFLVLIFLIIIHYLLSYSAETISIYSRYIFRPFQNVRNILFGSLPFSFGDILYVAGGIALTLLVVRWILYTAKIKTYGHNLLSSFIRTLSAFVIVYIIFFLGWGGNYYKPTLTKHWKLDTVAWDRSDSFLVKFDRFLVDKLNAYAPHYKDLSFDEVDKRSRSFYKKYTDSETKMRGLNAKPSVFGNLMEYFAIQGYYNPFTGEAQVNRNLPGFMLPFVVCHELAHQSGIAAEDDANLLAYAIGTRVDDPSFRYSSYLNVWLYTNSKLRILDSVRAKAFQDELNPLSVAHLDTLRTIRRKYRSIFRRYSGFLYDNYLRLHNQQKGLDTYDDVAGSAWAWEQRRATWNGKLISIP